MTLPTDSAERKMYPLVRGLLDYFPNACMEVARHSWICNEKHNPGEPMHHARGKSTDHADCIGRHLIERGGFEELKVTDPDTGVVTVYRIRHSTAMAWRALALLQEELEAELYLPLPRGARPAEPVRIIDMPAKITAEQLAELSVQPVTLAVPAGWVDAAGEFHSPPRDICGRGR